MAVRTELVGTVTEDFSQVMDLVYFRARWGQVEASAYENEIYSGLVEEYSNQIKEELVVIGCGSRSVHLTNEAILADLRRQAHDLAVGIVDTYNRDLAYAIRAISTETPTANRTTYWKRIDEWEDRRDEWKDAQIAMMTRNSAKNMSVKEFVRRNRIQAMAYVGGPRPAAEEDCQRLIDGEPYPANQLPAEFPLHINCPHYWDLRNEEAPMPCEEVWAGE